MSRSRTVMKQVLDVLATETTGITSATIAQRAGITVSQAKDALKSLSNLDQIRRKKDPDSTRGFLYLPLKPPAYQFFDPALFSDEEITLDPLGNPVAWMGRQLVENNKNHFSTLGGDLNTAHAISSGACNA